MQLRPVRRLERRHHLDEGRRPAARAAGTGSLATWQLAWCHEVVFRHPAQVYLLQSSDVQQQD